MKFIFKYRIGALVLPALLPFAFAPNALLAEDAKTGRLPDGRAYRTDSQGNEIVDYIAELELSIESLQRQVQGLETESERKQEIIDSMRAGKGGSPSLAEKDLISGAVTNVKEACPPPVKVVASCPPAPPAKSCDEYINQARNYARIVEDQKLDMEVNQERHARELQSSRSEIARLQDELREKSDDERAAMAKVASLEEAVRAQKESSVLERSQRSEPAVIKSAANIPAVPPDTAVSDWPPAASANFEFARSQAVQALQVKMQRDLNSLEALVASRNTLYQRYSRMATAQEIKPESIELTRRKIESYRQGIHAASKVHELSDIRLEINNLRGEIQREIAIMRRVVR